MRAVSEMVADLDGVRPAEALLLDDLVYALPRSKQERSDSGRNGRGNLGNLFIADDARPARHVRHQAQGRTRPHSTAIAASSTLAMQQIFTRGVRVGFMVFPCDASVFADG